MLFLELFLQPEINKNFFDNFKKYKRQSFHDLVFTLYTLLSLLWEYVIRCQLSYMYLFIICHLFNYFQNGLFDSNPVVLVLPAQTMLLRTDDFEVHTQVTQ